MPQQHKKRSEIIFPKSNEYLVVAKAFHHPILLEKVEQMKLPKKSFSTDLAKAVSKLYAPSLRVTETTGNNYGNMIIFRFWMS